MENVEKFSMDSYDYPSMEEFIRQMDSYHWENVPENIVFSIDWEAEDPFSRDGASWFWMEATEEASICTVTTEVAKKEFEKFKAMFLIFSKYEKKVKSYRKKLHELYVQMDEELKNI